ncbi:MAG: hypothetical protein ACLFNB_02175 [Candidatus Woesearchaeota archaeon]
MRWIVLVALIAFVSLFLLTGCTSSVTEIKTDENLNKTVRAGGVVQDSIKIGDLSGYTIEDDTGSIAVASEELPEEGDEIVVKGTLRKGLVIGYYIEAEE